MNKLQFTVSDECIGCKACVEIADANFDMNDSNIAYLKKQPENSEEETICQEALEACPVDAISVVERSHNTSVIEPVLSNAIIKTTLDTYPQLKPVLVKLSPKFKKLQNPAMYNTIAKFATFKDAARLTGLSVCEILHTMNKTLGVEDKLIEKMPDCISLHKEEVF